MDEFESAIALKEYTKSMRAIMERCREMYYKMGIAVVGVPFAVSKEVPTWNLGKGNVESFRFEYIGATK